MKFQLKMIKYKKMKFSIIKLIKKKIIVTTKKMKKINIIKELLI